MWHDELQAEIVGIFHDLAQPDFRGLRVFRRLGRPDAATPEARAAKRAEFEASRREYKTRKQREYDARNGGAKQHLRAEAFALLEAGVSTYEVARRLGISRSTLVRWRQAAVCSVAA